MHNVDFLPAEYRRRTRERRDTRWRLTALGFTGLLLSVVTVRQHFARLSLEQQLAATEARASVVQTQAARLSELVKARQAAAARAELITWLRHPWPRSQILAGLIGPLPDSVTLTSLHISREQPPASPAVHTPPQTVPSSQTTNPHLKDLETLRAELGPASVVAQIDGMTTDPAALHDYVEKLAHQHLVIRADLLGVDRVSDPTAAGYRFSLRVFIRHALGQVTPDSTMPAVQPADVPLAGSSPG